MGIIITEECTGEPINLTVVSLNNRSIYSAEISIFNGNNTLIKNRIRNYYIKAADSTQLTNKLGTSFDLTENGTYTLLVESAGYHDVKYVFDLKECIKDITIQMEPEETIEIEESDEEYADSEPETEDDVEDVMVPEEESVDSKPSPSLMVIILLIIGLVIYFLLMKRDNKTARKK